MNCRREPDLTLYSMIGVLMVIATWRGIESAIQVHSQRPPLNTVNPNTAPWWEMTLLPQFLGQFS